MQGEKVLFKDVSNIAVDNFYFLMGSVLKELSGVTLGGGNVFPHQIGAGTLGITDNVPAGSLIWSHTDTVFGVYAGSDTATVTSLTMSQVATPISDTLVAGGSNSVTASSGGKIQLACTFPAHALGAGAVTLGEFGLYVGRSSVNADVAMLSRVAVADGANLGLGSGVPITINADIALNILVTIYL